MKGRRKILNVVILMMVMCSLLFFISGSKGTEDEGATGKTEKKAKEITLTVAVLSGVHKDPFLTTSPKFKDFLPDILLWLRTRDICSSTIFQVGRINPVNLLLVLEPGRLNVDHDVEGLVILRWT